ncbi:MAG TPA: hypothetical protein VFG69_00805, partial [Nannocystaceae bacterium]|nr:hypothetical protein [Nannocystaceae bacterium]
MTCALVSSILAVTLSFHPYAVGHRAARTTSDGDAAATSTSPPPPGLQSDHSARRHADEHEVVRPKTLPGAGLTIAAALTFATAWGITIGKIVLADRCNESIEAGGDAMDQEVTLYKCFTNVKSILGLTVGGWFANWATWGLAAAAGGVRGKDDGVRYAWEGRPKYAAGGLIAGGATMFGVGLIGVGLSRGLALTRILRCDANANLNNCLTRGFRGYFAGVQIAS